MPTSKTSEYQQHLFNFYSVLKAKLKFYRDAKRRLDRFHSTDFNVFKWIEPENKDLLPEQIRRFEKRRSAIIADLLKPSGSHGQKRKFLDAFLRQIEKDDLCDKQLRQVATEYRIENPEGYIDVLVDFQAFVIAIENKPWADDGDAQLSNYHAYLEDTYKDQFCLIYLTQKDRLRPTSKSIEEDKCSKLIQNRKLLLLSYNPDILKWLEECCRLCESDKFRWFLRDFMDHINGGQSMASQKEQEIILAHALEEKNLETALDVGFAFDDLRKEIIVGFLKKLENFVLASLPDSSRWYVNDETLRHSPLKEQCIFSFGKKSWGERYGVGLQPYEDKLIIGVWRQPTESAVRIDCLKETLDKKLKPGSSSRDWEWWCYLAPYRNWNTTEILIKLHNGEGVNDIGQELVGIIKEAEPIIDAHVQVSSS